MTVSSETNQVDFSGNGSTDTFAYSFKIFADGDLTVILRDSDDDETVLILDSNYTVTGAGEESGGNVVMGTAPATGETLVIRRVLDITQETDYVENDAFPAATHEDALDRATMVDLQQQNELDRCVKGKTSTDWSSIDLILPDPLPDAPIGWSPDGLSLVNNPAGSTIAASVAAAQTAQSGAETAETNAEAAQSAAEIAQGLAESSQEAAEAAATSASAAAANPSCNHGFHPRYKDADELYVGAGVLEIDGVICTLSAETAFDMDAALGGVFIADQYYCFGFNKPSSGTSLTSSEFVCSEIIPTWNESMNGWYLPAPHSGGTAIASGTLAGGYAAAGAFIPAYNGGTSGNVWASDDQGATVSGSAYIGYDFGAGTTCAPTKILICQNTLADYAISSAKVQYSDDGIAWSDHETIAITDPSPSLRGEIITLASAGGSHRYWRLLANDNTAAACSWFVHYLHFISEDTDWVRIINNVKLNGSADIDANSKWARDTYHHSYVVILSDTTPLWASVEAISASIPQWGVPVDVGGWAQIANAAANKDMYIYDGALTIAASFRTQVGGIGNFMTWAAGTNSSGQIGHNGSNSTYTTYEIYQVWERLPAGM